MGLSATVGGAAEQVIRIAGRPVRDGLNDPATGRDVAFIGMGMHRTRDGGIAGTRHLEDFAPPLR